MVWESSNYISGRQLVKVGSRNAVQFVRPATVVHDEEEGCDSGVPTWMLLCSKVVCGVEWNTTELCDGNQWECASDCHRAPGLNTVVRSAGAG